MKQKLNNCHFNNRQNGLHLPRGSRRLKIEHFCRQNAAEISKNVNFQTDKVQGEFQSVKMASKMRKFLGQFFATILVCWKINAQAKYSENKKTYETVAGGLWQNGRLQTGDCKVRNAEPKYRELAVYRYPEFLVVWFNEDEGDLENN